jgi:hypothetical protein
MAYQATIISVMIASPGDVAAERSTIQTIIHNWNTVNAEERRTVLMPLMWETHSTPEMGDRAQSIINRQVLEKCDLLVGVFWTRIGSPTESSSSGTVEEIRRHIASGKPAMLYFSQTAVALDSVDRDQYEAVRQFREECKRTGLIATYDSLPAFSEQFSRNLSQIVRDRFSPGSVSSATEEAPRIAPARSTISKTAKVVLIAAADGQGEILRIPLLGGTSIRAGTRQLETGDGKELARWEAAIRELVDVGLVEPKGHKNEVFRVTHDGYETADRLRAEGASVSED